MIGMGPLMDGLARRTLCKVMFVTVLGGNLRCVVMNVLILVSGS